MVVADRNTSQTSLAQLNNLGEVFKSTTNSLKKVSNSPKSTQDLTMTVGGIRKY
jgi:hypothetical protein